MSFFSSSKVSSVAQEMTVYESTDQISYSSPTVPINGQESDPTFEGQHNKKPKLVWVQSSYPDLYSKEAEL